ncbi:MAG: SAM-dependent chlorinase/fluorinase [Acidobacteriota bacterium]
MAPQPIALLTDFGGEDYYVAAVRGVLWTRSPGSPLLDVSHQVRPGDVVGASFLAWAAAAFLPSGSVLLAVVDPGVGSARRIVACRWDLPGGTGGWLVGPDNGLFSPFLVGRPLPQPQGLSVAPSVRSVEVERPDLYLDLPGSTFHGRDRFAPVAAALARGMPLEDFGQPLEQPVILPNAAPPQQEAHELLGRVVHIDRFGNLVTDIPTLWIDAWGSEAAVEVGVVTEDGEASCRRRGRYYAELEEDEAGLLPGSLGTLELALRNDSLARRWGVRRGAMVRVSRH